MSRVDWDAMVAELSEKRTAVARELEDIDAVLAAVRQRASGIPAPARARQAKRGRAKPARARPTAKKPAKKPATNGQRPRLDEAVLAAIRKQYESGADVGEIARQAGKSVAGIYYYASSRNWKRPATPKPAAKASSAPRTGTKLSGEVTCNWCQLKTGYDPCEKCGKKLKRSWS